MSRRHTGRSGAARSSPPTGQVLSSTCRDIRRSSADSTHGRRRAISRRFLSLGSRASFRFMTGVAAPRLFAPPPDTNDPRETAKGIGVWRFPEWFVVQEASSSEERERSRRLVHRKALDNKGRFDGRPVVATRFVRACPKGHVDDLDWRRFVHGAEDTCRRQLWLDERGTSGDLADLVVRCECGKSRSLYEATQLEMNPLGTCRGARPWLGRNTERRLQAAEPPANPHGLQRVFSPSGKRAVAAGPGKRGGDGR